jgi:hypothetical protein
MDETVAGSRAGFLAVGTQAGWLRGKVSTLFLILLPLNRHKLQMLVFFRLIVGDIQDHDDTATHTLSRYKLALAFQSYNTGLVTRNWTKRYRLHVRVVVNNNWSI